MISFIVIGKNEGSRLERSLQSVLDVTKVDNIQDWELVYVDSQSTDDSLKVAKSKGARTFLITGECNAAIARNIGAKEAQGDIFFFIDGDMEVQSGFLPQVIEDGQLVYPFLSGNFEDIVYDNDWNYLRTTYRHRFAEGEEFHYDSTTGGLFLITRELWEKVSGMDNRLKRSQDYDLGLRVTKVGWPLKRMNLLLAKHHMRDYELRDDYVENVRYTALLLRKHWNNLQYLKVFINSQYTTIALVLSIILMFCSVYSIFIYVFAIGYKWYRRHSHTITMLKRIIATDLTIIYALLTYHPKQSVMIYKRIK